MLEVRLYRYNPECDDAPYMQSLSLPEEFRSRMVLDALWYLREQDPTLAYRRSCLNPMAAIGMIRRELMRDAT
uniref:2Fe-2S iron-sulfur cluster-binding protein n=1 Tax=Marinobacterium profundum TaxID=1714300 RepID=UPI001315486E